MDGTVSAGSLDGMCRDSMYRLAIEVARVVDCLLLGASTGSLASWAASCHEVGRAGTWLSVCMWWDKMMMKGFRRLRHVALVFSVFLYIVHQQYLVVSLNRRAEDFDVVVGAAEEVKVSERWSQGVADNLQRGSSIIQQVRWVHGLVV